MCRKYRNHWTEYRDAIDLMNHPSNMDIGLCWYLNGTKKKWTYNLADPLMIDLETIISLASMTNIVNLDAYELLPGVEKVFNNLFLDEC